MEEVGTSFVLKDVRTQNDSVEGKIQTQEGNKFWSVKYIVSNMSFHYRLSISSSWAHDGLPSQKCLAALCLGHSWRN